MEVSSSGQIQEFVSVLKRRKWLIILPALFVLVLGTVFAVIVPKKYVIETVIELREANLSAAQANKRLKESAVDSEVSNIESHVRNFTRIAGILERDPEAWPTYAQADRLQRQGMVKAIVKNLSVNPQLVQEGSTFINIFYKDVESLRGENFLGEVVEVAIDDILDSARDLLQREIDTQQGIRDGIHANTVQARSAWNSLSGEFDLDPTIAPSSSTRDVKSKHERLNDLIEKHENNLSALQRDKKDLDLRIEQIEDDLHGMSDQVLNPGEKMEIDPVELAGKILKGEQALADAQRVLELWNPGNHIYDGHLAKRDDLAEQLEMTRALMNLEEPPGVLGPNPVYLTLKENREQESDVRFLNLKQQEALREDIDAAKLDRKGWSVVLSQAKVLWRDHQQFEDELVASNKKLGEKKYAMRLSKELTHKIIMRVATPAHSSETAEDPNPFLIIGFCLFAGLGLGLGLALLIEYARNSYRTVPDLASVMSVPVIGSIGAIVTRREARRSLGLRLMVGLPSLIILCGISWMTWTWADESTRHVLPEEVNQIIEGIRVSLLSL